MRIQGLDHVVLTAADMRATIEFYSTALGMEALEFEGGRRALRFGDQKINLHQAGKEFEPKAQRPTPGSLDLCFVTSAGIEEIVGSLEERGVAIEVGPVDRIGARGAMRSVYIRDPDGNLVEIASYGA